LTFVEQEYQRRIQAMSPAEKFTRMHALNEGARWNIARIITEQSGPLTTEALKWRVALWTSGRNPACRTLIEEQLARVSAH
jgi:hypothetical protein